jgi:hypothetical protein
MAYVFKRGKNFCCHHLINAHTGGSSLDGYEPFRRVLTRLRTCRILMNLFRRKERVQFDKVSSVPRLH